MVHRMYASILCQVSYPTLTRELLTVTPAFFGAGMLSGLNASWSFCERSYTGSALVFTLTGP